MAIVQTMMMPTSSAEMAMPPGPPHRRPEDRLELPGCRSELDPQVLADDEGEPESGDDERNVITAWFQQTVDQRHLEHIAEQEHGDRDRDGEGGDDPDLRERPGQLDTPDRWHPLRDPEYRPPCADDQNDHRGDDDELAVGEVDRSGGLPQ